MINRIAFVTYSAQPKIQVDDLPLVDALSKENIQCVGVPWDDSSVNWIDFDMVLIRSCWNYHLHEDRFRNWVKSLESKVRMVNSSQLILWNLNKKYLLELANNGVGVPETEVINAESFHPEKIHELFKEKNWYRAILKPCVSASSYKTIIVTKDNALEIGRALNENFPSGGMLLQEFVNEISETGELSLIYFNGEFSHAVLKTVSNGEFRVQKEFGGAVQYIEVEKNIIEQAGAILKKLPAIPNFARIDGFVREGKFILMEMELIEPVLFFTHNEVSAVSFANHLLRESQHKVTAKNMTLQ